MNSNARRVGTLTIVLSMHARAFWAKFGWFMTVYCYFLHQYQSQKWQKGQYICLVGLVCCGRHFTWHKSVLCVSVGDIDSGRVYTGVISISPEALLGAVHPALMRPESIFRSHFILVQQRLRFVPIKVIKTTGCHISLHTEAGKLGRKDRASENPWETAMMNTLLPPQGRAGLQYGTLTFLIRSFCW